MKLITLIVLILLCFEGGNFLRAQNVDSTKMYHIDEVDVSAPRVRKEVIPVQVMKERY